MTLESHRIEIDSVDFQISCRRFTVRATVTRDRQLPVVDEFVLRLLAILDRISVTRMRYWFGFSAAEMETALLDMGRRSLIEFDGNEAMLAPAGRDLFKSCGVDGVPHIVEVAPIVADVWFDLVSRTMVPRSRSRSSEYMVKVTEQPDARDIPEAFARRAFEDNFRDYARRIRRIPDPDAINLYSISGVEGGAFGYQSLQAKLVLDLDRIGVRPTFSEAADSASGFQKLAVAANDAWQVVTGPDLASGAMAEFERMTGDARLFPLLQRIDERSAWVEAFRLAEVSGSGYRPCVGATYLKGNIERLLLKFAEARFEQPITEVIWARPSGSTWGRTTRVAEALAEVRDALRNNNQADVKAVIAMPRSTIRSARLSHKRIFDRGVLLPQGHLPSNIEIFLIPGIAAFVIIHVPVQQHSVPIGGLITEPKRLSRIADRLRIVHEKEVEELWSREVVDRDVTGAASGDTASGGISAG
ncbi:hypothetical protein [Xanthobacter flavus]|uniref:hypothetical protein n=1 Tax=Xanthobacter flavus TaxID=281 RepID=UPI00372CA663